MPEASVLRRRRRLFGLLVLGTGGLGTLAMHQVLVATGAGLLQVPLLVLFAILFTWIALAFWNAMVGALLLHRRLDPLTLKPCAPEPILHAPHRTALIMPIRHEDAGFVGAGLAATLEDLAASGDPDGFEAFVLSDSSDPVVLHDEARMVVALQRRFEGRIPVHYRHGREPGGRKAGNIAEFCRRWGGRYEALVVLDADSRMSGHTLRRLVADLQADPQTGLIQTVPRPMGAETLLARVQALAAQLHGPLLAAGQAFWQADTANYWGHNAILRTRAFADCCGLPRLPGAAPWGGDILSHDFVEAALLRRGGWHVRLDTGADGSLEQVPANLSDYLRRERRWAQGNLQHLRLLGVPGLHPLSRLHFLLGALGFVYAPLWAAMLILGFVSLATATEAGSAALTPGAIPETALWLLGATLVLLLGPKAVGLALVRDRRHSFGGTLPWLGGGLLEMLSAVLLAPVLMAFHTLFILQILAGRPVSWEAPCRAGRLLGWRRCLRLGLPPALLGLCWLVLCLLILPALALWSAPVWLGLMLAPVLFRLSGRRAPSGLLVTPPAEAVARSPAGEAVERPPSSDRPCPPPPESPLAMPARMLIGPP
ncbi:glucans biosynthesis glucosyltransferase MdoH [Ectothiorhodospira variabilis]|uniref:glucans biosynthesis glucosyltransferase MdoH n=1 Tax=Ectothiorhodospira variabilis TaxID=505694 RepID=UPI001EFA8A7B|nr:glucans biosynthesis glucosyltransferase MdoH [Ectothiorhodospira variabilis]MCG5494629.1 glucans biosynthesis glucosyltransferase MdoH [Ectothiorhodospira variabilis]MCG5503620.1 glucans biosynthesis glucosyltransferase MdoH [Ectothiorhodospira variabilis]MCG5506665.1 glucans biosynthesis glucosyltransferase MdoH [Ectothiorhodospira variabilis]